MEEKQGVWLEFFIGLPASGKTTYFNQNYKDDPSIVRVSRDDLRNMRGQYWLPKDEDLISDWEIVTAGIALMNGKNVVIDATNLNPQRRASFLHKVDQFITSSGNQIPISVRHRNFDVSVDECVKRDAQRGLGQQVGRKVIVHMAMANGLYKHPYPEYQQHEAGLKSCIIVDLDGTLALNRTNRDAYAVDQRVMEDDLNHPVAMVIDWARQDCNEIIIFSGRSEASRGYTDQWLTDRKVFYDELVMRKIGDNRSDDIVKREMYEEWVKGKYNVEFIMDDRDKVVKMWRGLNLPVFQVNYGDF